MRTNRSRQFRNPRYAPESLERKLSPSDLLGGLAAPPVLVSTDGSDGGVGDAPIPPEPGTGPFQPPTFPTGGPVGPA